MFLQSLKPTYTAPVTVEIPVDAGKTLKVVLDVEFNRLERDELIALGEQINSGGLEDKALIEHVAVGLKAVKENGRDVPVTDGMWEEALKVVQVPPAVINTFFKSVQGARAKN